MRLRLDINDVPEKFSKENFRKIAEFVSKTAILLANFEHFEINIDGAKAHFKYTHNLGFIPKDIIVTSVTGNGVVTFNVEEFTKEAIDITSTGKCTIRFFAGTYDKRSS